MRRAQITFDEFKIIFQVTKEIPNLPETAELPQDPDLRDELLRCIRMARQIARAARPNPILIDVIENESPAMPRLEEASSGADGASVVKLEMPRELIGIWRPLAEKVLAQMDGRELFLRTGYEVNEMREAIESLPPA
ncbi:hypothetical protein [Streptomyces iranensis]|uniref:Uncharacterized protein n=1 Tax=Streptomyces iranensis TaxID=576784 RepID=A0A061A298_9ACTN|nr:hypothetical protein [Streptomyces iranensis]MBP2065068.1 hypothetical protein [Streptomyces iranensis]CDR09983.1 predicted protein [Streptomyces iranensis]